ncbi:translocation and assembly module lipoprotein TamL [Nonlabens ulvanivorans]|uniref:translocation and assembly module lipoprotein TamL n=1 Tax=Nonlabens ulvanivorans TaxID=906888 RepID=UPI002941D940|nr:BamA/TamA family outer membrane protein [Nonlabens ulvanivorans]WOI21952.1 BamA/TamA family outer membrane protein [Nonlabens ulvanivorans]
MKKSSLLAKIGLIITVIIVLTSCNAIKRVPEGKKLLVDNTILVDSVAPKDPRVKTLLVQQPNNRILTVPVGLHFYNLARPHRDSIYLKWMQENPNGLKRRNKILSEKQTIQLGQSLVDFNSWIKRTGEEPAILELDDITKSKERLRAWYWNQGWFNTEVTHEIIDSDKKQRAEVVYTIKKHQSYKVDSIKTRISSPLVDSLYQANTQGQLITAGEQYYTPDFNAERDRLMTLFRNNGIFYMEKEFIKFEGDTVNTKHKANIAVIIDDREIKDGDSIIKKPFLIHKISKINVYPDYEEALASSIPDTTRYKNINIIRYGEKKYRNFVLADAIFFHEGDIYRDIDRDRTFNRITELKSFYTPSIRLEPDPADSTGVSLIANILLTSKKKFFLKNSAETTHSNIQALGIGLNSSLVIRNLFQGSELLDINFRGSIGASADGASGDSRFFDLQEYGADARLSFPRLFFPIKTEKLIPKYMSPSTNLSIGFVSQTNIGLDKTSFNSILSYRWKPKPTNTSRFDLINAQYVRNLDPGDFFNVYNSTYNSLNAVAEDLNINNPIYLNDDNDLSIPQGTSLFTRDVLNGSIATTSDQRETVRNIEERRDRLTQNNLIVSTSYNWIRNTQKGIYDDDYSLFSIRVESAGNVLAGITSLVGEPTNSDGNRTAFGVEYSQYAKTEIDYIKHWQLFSNNVFAIRAFGGIAIPYGNSDNIPFTRSFFGGGPNDNRAWQAYELGPGSTGGINDFNEANMKLAFNGEYRFTINGSFKGALFVDAGNIWNVLDNEDNPDAQFKGIADLSTISVGSGFGIRYDFGFFVLRLDTGFKTFNPALEEGRRWFKEIKIPKAVFNVGINYPF